jgi:anti-sigma regulatory factor (Ser/Thr protein kinase)
VGSGELTLEPLASQVRVARRHVTAACEGLTSELVHDAQLLVSELVSNAIQHGKGQITVSIARSSRGVRVDVGDEGAGRPGVVAAGTDQLRGRGLMLLDRIAAEWGVAPRKGGPGKVVWFSLRAAAGPASD